MSFLYKRCRETMCRTYSVNYSEIGSLHEITNNIFRKYKAKQNEKITVLFLYQTMGLNHSCATQSKIQNHSTKDH